jgi:hypothetical protein
VSPLTAQIGGVTTTRSVNGCQALKSASERGRTTTA